MLGIDYLAALREKYRDALTAQVKEFKIGDRTFSFNSFPAIMGVVNLSPDSWYRESVCLSADRAIARGRVLAAQGAALIDIGAESTLAQAARTDEGAQMKRLLPVIQGLREGGILVSVETYQASVAKACLEQGANVLNLTGSEAAEEVYPILAEREATLILCYVQGPNVREVGELRFDKDPIGVMYDYFARAVEVAQRYGIQRILIDPGLGFYYRNLQDSSARVRFQMEVFLNSFRLRVLGFPVCQALPHAFEYFGEEVRSAEGFFAVWAALGRTDLFRTHEVPRVKAVLETMALMPAEM